MCGIAVAIPPEQSTLDHALRAMALRGPDAAGTADLGFASVAVTRLAITDVAHGHQPFVTDIGASRVVFNGAIYNVADLASRYGLHLPTGNDGEVIWPLYQRFGIRFADQLEGMFAICIADGRRGEVVLAVDQVGIKPLLLARTGSGWAAASTLQALPPAVRAGAVRFPPGTVWSSSGQVHRIEPPAVDGALADLLARSVQEQIPTEIGWGCLLSGGLDSSVVTALAARQSPTVHTFTSGLAGSADLAAAREVADFLGTDHHEEVIDRAELGELIDAVISATASPDPFTVLAGLGTYAAAGAAARMGLKVLLSGEGADELFAGYDDYLRTPRDQLDACLVHNQVDLGATECLRLDRCTMAQGIEARVPFLSSSLIRKARSLPLADKLDTSGAVPVHKVALRRLAANLLPPATANRHKAGFPDGAGLTAAVTALAGAMVSGADVAALADDPAGRQYLATQRDLGIDDRVATLMWRRWSARFPELPDSWPELVRRGLVRRRLADGEYRLPTMPTPVMDTHSTGGTR